MLWILASIAKDVSISDIVPEAASVTLLHCRCAVILLLSLDIPAAGRVMQLWHCVS